MSRGRLGLVRRGLTGALPPFISRPLQGDISRRLQWTLVLLTEALLAHPSHPGNCPPPPPLPIALHSLCLRSGAMYHGRLGLVRRGFADATPTFCSLARHSKNLALTVLYVPYSLDSGTHASGENRKGGTSRGSLGLVRRGLAGVYT